MTALVSISEAIAQILTAAPGVSDIIVCPGRPVMAEISGLLGPAPQTALPQPLEAAFVHELVRTLIGDNPSWAADYAATGSCDLSFSPDPRARFRVNIFKRRGEPALVMRRLPARPPTLAELGLPEPIPSMARERFGLILVTGATGSGKSTTLAAVVDQVLATRAVHVVTLEDPIEFTFPDHQGLVSQRELGADFVSFAGGLRAALRQAPKVILVGEMRDKETMEAALTAAETGHLVLSTLHTPDAGSTVNRLIGMFDPAEAGLIRQRLAQALTWVVSQRLVPLTSGGRAPAFEIMRTDMQIRERILLGETGEKTFVEVIERGSAKGMVSFDQYLLGLYQAGKISAEAALLAASDRAKLTRGLDAHRAAKGEKVSDIGGLTLDEEYGKN